MATFAEMLEKARQAGACDNAIELLSTYSNIAEASKDEFAPYWAYWYAREVLKGRFEEGESVIATDAEWSYYYACDVLNGRFILAEPIIATDAEWSDCYNREVLNQ